MALPKIGDSSGVSAATIKGGFKFGIGALVVFSVATLVVWLFGTSSLDKGECAAYSYKPLFAGFSGISNEVAVGPGVSYMMPTTSLEKVKFIPYSMTIHAHDFMAKDRVPLSFDISVTVQLADCKRAPAMLRAFGSGPVTTFKTLVLQDDGKGNYSGELMSFLRDQVRHHSSSVFINAQTDDGENSDGARDVERNTISHLTAFLKSRGADMVVTTNIALGKANPPEGVKAAIARTAIEAQEQKTQVRRKTAAESRKSAETAVAEADLAYMTALNITADQFIQLKRVELIEKVCGKEATSPHCNIVVGESTPVAVRAGK